MADLITKIVHLHVDCSLEEIQLGATGFTRVVADYRSAWQSVLNMCNQNATEPGIAQYKVDLARNYLKKCTEEMEAYCFHIIACVDEFLSNSFISDNPEKAAYCTRLYVN